MTTDRRLYAHRGSSQHLPENTLEAFRQALEDGATALELDVQRTCDGHWVVSHDDSGRRMAAVEERIAAATLAQVRRWDVGAGFTNPAGEHPHAGKGYRMPLLTEVLDELCLVPMSVDLKPDDTRHVGELLELIAAHGASERVTLASFHDRVVETVRRLGYDGPTALTRGEVAMLRFLPLSLARRRIRGQAAQVPRRSGPIRLDSRRFIDRCARLGIRSDYWVINLADSAQTLLHRGATGIMTDDPARIVRALPSSW